MKMRRWAALLIAAVMSVLIISGCSIERPDDLANEHRIANAVAQLESNSVITEQPKVERNDIDTSPPQQEKAEEPDEQVLAGETINTPSEQPQASQQPAQQSSQQENYYDVNDYTAKDHSKYDKIGGDTPSPVDNTNVNYNSSDYVYLEIRCDTILDNMSKLRSGKEELVPDDGVIFQRKKVLFYEGETVFDVLQRETKGNRIHMEHVFTRIYNSVYVQGINNLYEFDCGELSGWMYSVNDWVPNYGCSRYVLKSGDDILWAYTCDLGEDVGGDWMMQQEE